MPELPEVETIRRGLQERIVGKTIAEIDIRYPKIFQGKKEDVVGKKIVEVKRRAKVLALKLSHDTNLLFHLKMTGQLIYIDRNEERFAGGHPDHNWHAKLPNSATAIIFDFGDKTHLYFNDLRKFGWCKVMSDEELNKVFTEEYGPEPFSDGFTSRYLMLTAAKIPNRKIKQFLTDQAIVAGIGNIYVDETLFESQISPLRKVRDIETSEWEKILEDTKKILEKAIELGGTTDSDYVNAEGKKGGMQDYLKVYRKADEDCPNGCGEKIIRITVGGRGTHYCKNCQK